MVLVKFDEEAASIPPDEGCEVFDREVTHEKWDKNNNKNATDRDDTHIFIKGGSL